MQGNDSKVSLLSFTAKKRSYTVDSRVANLYFKCTAMITTFATLKRLSTTAACDIRFGSTAQQIFESYKRGLTLK